MSKLKKREWHSDKRAFEDHPKPCGHKRDSWICAQCADKQINFAEAEVAGLKHELERRIKIYTSTVANCKVRSYDGIKAIGKYIETLIRIRDSAPTKKEADRLADECLKKLSGNTVFPDCSHELTDLEAAIKDRDHWKSKAEALAEACRKAQEWDQIDKALSAFESCKKGGTNWRDNVKDVLDRGSETL